MEILDRWHEALSEFNRGSSCRRRRSGGGRRLKWGRGDTAASPVAERYAPVAGRGGDGKIRRMRRSATVVDERRSARKLAAGVWWRHLAAGPGGVTWHPSQHPRSSGRLQLGVDSVSNKIGMEGATKNWDHFDCKSPNEVSRFHRHHRLHPNNIYDDPAATITGLQLELVRARNCGKQLETERHFLKEKLKHFLKGLNQETESWMKRERIKMLQIVSELKGDLEKERQKCRNMVNINSRLLMDLADADSSHKKTMLELEKEKSIREFLENVCLELRDETKGHEGNLRAMVMECERIQEEVEEERKMMQMAEVWREELLQMRLVNAKLILEDKYSQMNNLIADMEAVLSRSKDASSTPPDDVFQDDDAIKIEENGFNRRSWCLPGGRRNPHVIARKMRGCIEWPQGGFIPKMINCSKAYELGARKCSCVMCLSKQSLN
ncbi:OLC1v1021206C1 [Oldenlandia corymbosa var. corymbosa]|uniref:OLC1v1021206C1 n=1 Tax=Oldenlandia corymbosa var. corymbosa TaxID=529605 RepID=A0AAV1BXD5_OLDCO|nr:OLC1v1021206C1 [Oldenlandia corymbosa var. corymbosa]